MGKFSELYQQIKHDGRRLTPFELVEIENYLRKSGSESDFQSHAAIYLFCYSKKPTKNNVQLIERFLSDDAADYARQAAINCLVRVWGIKDQNIGSMIEIYLKLDKNEYPCTRSAAIVSAIVYAIEYRDRKFSKIIDNLASDMYLRVKSGSEDYGDEFVFLINTAINAKSKKAGKRARFLSSVDEAIDVFEAGEVQILTE